MDTPTPPMSPSESSSGDFTPTLSPASRAFVDSLWPGSGTAVSGTYRLPPASWSPLHTDSDATVEIPEYLESRETLAYMKFDPGRARKIMKAYDLVIHPSSMWSYSFFDLVKLATFEPLKGIKGETVFESSERDNYWVKIFEKCGMSSNFYGPIMNRDKRWRLFTSPRFWIELYLRLDWQFLSELDSKIQQQQERRTRQQHNDSEDKMDDAPVECSTAEGDGLDH